LAGGVVTAGGAVPLGQISQTTTRTTITAAIAYQSRCELMRALPSVEVRLSDRLEN
jgi:hypothetical protein